MEQKFRNYSFTSFEDEEPVVNLDKFKYLAYSREICPETARGHWQGFICWNSPRTVSSVRKQMKPMHVESMRGSISQNVVYCSKDGLLIEHGNRPCQGKRFDILELKKCKKMSDVALMARSNNDIKIMENFMKYHEDKRNWKPEVFWFWGAPGCGKTRQAIQDAGKDYWISGGNGKWFDGYDAHENVIFDDVRVDFMKFNIWLRLLDRYPYTVEVKGGCRQFLAKKIWITSCQSPEQMFCSNINDDIAQLTRRINQTKLFGSEVGGNTRPLLLKW